jgi:hypothetical protein
VANGQLARTSLYTNCSSYRLGLCPSFCNTYHLVHPVEILAGGIGIGYTKIDPDVLRRLLLHLYSSNSSCFSLSQLRPSPLQFRSAGGSEGCRLRCWRRNKWNEESVDWNLTRAPVLLPGCHQGYQIPFLGS